MNILLVSQCSKNALTETRRILDQFAERNGYRTWQTTITEQGLNTLRVLLRRTARRNTAVACHWLKSGHRSELLWIVGNQSAFNARGVVPTNTTSRDILRGRDEDDWHTLESVALLSALAGLFHDFGKCNSLFQKKLKPTSKLKSEPLRHEWISLRLFQAFVAGRRDQEWLEELASGPVLKQEWFFESLLQDTQEFSPNPFFLGKNQLPLTGIAKAVAWLILSHHRLPVCRSEHFEPRIAEIDSWLTSKSFGVGWNSSQFHEKKWKEADFKSVWQFKSGTPFRSDTWRLRAQKIAQRVLESKQLFHHEVEWFEDRYSMHLARLALMFADHHYSAKPSKVLWGSRKYRIYANTDRETGQLKQQLDEHCIGVSQEALLFAKRLPTLLKTLPTLTRHRGFKRRSADSRFRWQDRAYDLARSVAEVSRDEGFFGVSMASTGCGKTFANARIMYGLANENLGCRFTIALGLRTLTLQTGEALRERLSLQVDDMAVLIGSSAVRSLHERTSHSAKDYDTASFVGGSESSEPLYPTNEYVRYEGMIYDGPLGTWLSRAANLTKLLSAPVVVSTIDHVIPATEGHRGGRQIAPMLRLLSSDLVLDEPDEFGLEDLPALCRLVNWAGLLGSRVLLSSATLQPALVQALYEAYSHGRLAYRKARGQGISRGICCAWFDETSVQCEQISELNSFVEFHSRFVSDRVERLSKEPALRRSAIIDMAASSTDSTTIVDSISRQVTERIIQLHDEHAVDDRATGKSVSVGLIRMANINPLVALAKGLSRIKVPDGYQLHTCVYHSRHPLAVRSHIEQSLDAVLSRRATHHISEDSSLHSKLKRFNAQNHVFLVFATPVAEVGRDHDYDWAIVEPSSMRSLIQLAGRLQRHRRRVPSTPNMLIWSKNFRAMKGERCAFTRPGFEASNTEFLLNDKDVRVCLEPAQVEVIDSRPSIIEPSSLDPTANLVALEHARLRAELLHEGRSGTMVPASWWWNSNATWCAELQRRTRFRKSRPEETFALYFEEFGERPAFYKLPEFGGEIVSFEEQLFSRDPADELAQMSSWGTPIVEEMIENLADEFNLSIAETCLKFNTFMLPVDRDGCVGSGWRYHPLLGVYRELG